jgi:hypothetical protein
VGNWSASWNLVWLDDDDHIDDTLGRKGILHDTHAWDNFRAFVHQMDWGVEVSTTAFNPQVSPVQQAVSL